MGYKDTSSRSKYLNRRRWIPDLQRKTQYIDYMVTSTAAKIGGEKDKENREPDKKKRPRSEAESKKTTGEGEKKKDGKHKKGFMYEVCCLANQVIDTSKEGVDKPALINQISEKIKATEMTALQFGQDRLGSRIVQAMLKHGTVEQRKVIRLTYQEHFVPLVENKRGILLVQKIFTYCTKVTTAKELTEAEKKEQKAIISALMKPFLVEKTINKLVFHKLGCRFLNFLYFWEHMSGPMQNRLTNTIAFPKKISMLVDGIDLNQPFRANVDVLNKDQKVTVATHLGDVCDRLVDKELLEIDLAHAILRHYTEIETDANLKFYVQERLPMDGAIHLIKGKDGVAALVKLFGFISAKQRKAFINLVKGKWLECATNIFVYLVVIRLLETVDDTVLVTKTITKELTDELPDMITDTYGQKVLLSMLTSSDSVLRKRLLAPSDQTTLALPSPTSLKNPEMRRKEIAKPLLTALTPLLTSDRVFTEFATANVNVFYLIIAFFQNMPEDHSSREAFLKVVGEAIDKNIDMVNDGIIINGLLQLAKAEKWLCDGLWSTIKPRIEELLPTRFCLILLVILKAKPEIEQDLKPYISQLRTCAKNMKVKESGAHMLLNELEKKH